MNGGLYETPRLLAEYLLFHYGSADEILPYPFGPREALDYAVRCVTECLEGENLGPALDLGCAVGRSSFELTRRCSSVIGIDLSQSFIQAAETLRTTGSLPYDRVDEGSLRTPLTACIPTGAAPERLRFEVGDATSLREDVGSYDVVLMANLIDRLQEPMKCLSRLPSLVRSGGQLILSSPYTWLEEFTPRENWLGGFAQNDHRVSTLDSLCQYLEPYFELRRTTDLPFLIREHGRKFQWSVAQASIWRRR